MQRFQLLRRYLHTQLRHARNVAARTVKVKDRPSWTGSPPVSKTIGIVVVAAFAASAARVLVAAITATLLTNQISYHCRQPIGTALCQEVFDHDGMAIDVTGFAHPFKKGRQLPT